MLGVWRALLKRGISPAGRPISGAVRGLAEAAHSTVEEDQYSETEELEPTADQYLEDGSFHTRTLVVHEAFRKFRPPREAWIYQFSNPEQKRGLIELHPEVFAVNPRIDKIHEVLHWQDLCTRKEVIEYMRSELPGSGKKLRPQKGMGKARIKDKRAPQFKMGGVPLGLRPRDYGYDIDPMDLVAGFSAICTTKLAQGTLIIVDSLSGVSVPEMSDYKDTLSGVDSVLFVTGYDPGLTSGQNTEICFHPGIDLLTTEMVHPLSMVDHNIVVMDYAAVRQLEQWVLDIKGEHEIEERVENSPL
eukprot:sb/3467318/